MLEFQFLLRRFILVENQVLSEINNDLVDNLNKCLIECWVILHLLYVLMRHTLIVVD